VTANLGHFRVLKTVVGTSDILEAACLSLKRCNSAKRTLRSSGAYASNVRDDMPTDSMFWQVERYMRKLQTVPVQSGRWIVIEFNKPSAY